MKILTLTFSVFAVLMLSSCETTESGYGYVAQGLGEESITELIYLSDEAINERQYEIYTGLFAPGYYSLDRSNNSAMNRARLGRFEYFELVRDVFKHAKEIQVFSTITEIDIVEPGTRAVVTVHEDGLIDFQGERKRVVSINEIEVGYEDRWIYFESSTTTSKKDIKE